jgi:WD40 repeat protein
VTSWEPEGSEGGSGRQLVEIVHESLLKTWPRLVRWQTQDADGAQLRDQLRQAAHLWKERGGTEDLLWTGTAYLDYRAWRQNYRGGLSTVEEEFAKAMAARARRKRLLVRAAAAAIVLVSVGVSVAIGASRQRAVAAARMAEASKLLALAQLKLQEDPTEALALATASLEVSDSKEARLFALRALQEAPPAWEVPSGTSMARLPVFSPDGRRLAVAGLSPEVGVWDENGASPARLPGHEVTPRGGNKAMWASDELLVTGLDGRLGLRAHVWKASAPPAKVRTIDFEARTNWQVGGGQLFAESETSPPGVLALRSWKLPDGDAVPLGIVEAARFGATSGAFRPHERWIAGDPAESARLKAWSTAALSGARPLDLRREGSWYAAAGAFHPAGRLAVATTHNMSRLTFWPLPARCRNVVDGYKVVHRPLAFSPDGSWLATSWTDNRLHLWPVPGAASAGPKVLDTPPVEVWTALAFDPHGRYLFAVGRSDNAWIVPTDGSPGRKLHSYSKDTVIYACSASPTGSRVATAYYYGEGRKTLRVWDVETGKVLLFDLPQGSAAAEGAPRERTGIEGGVTSLAFVDDSTLLTAGEGGIRRWNLETGEHELIRAVADDRWIRTLSTDGREVLYCETSREERKRVISFGIIDLSTKVARPFEASAPSSPISATTDLHALFAAQGPIVALLGADGSVRVGNRSTGGFHWLLGHAGVPDRVAISPDLRWVASTGEDNTLRLWPMPDLSKPPLHTLPHDELVARLHSLTNLHAVRDPHSENGWKIELGPFPGWKNLPEWPP